LIWLLVIGGGLNALIDTGQGRYLSFLLPGVVAMTLLFGGMLSGLSLAVDREYGVLRLLIVAPVAHHWVVIAKWFAAAILAVLQAMMLLVVLWVIGLAPVPAGVVRIAQLFAGLAAGGMVCAALGVLCGAYAKTLDNMAVMMNFVIFPLFFLSGALYPVQRLPLPLKLVSAVNPFTYAVDLLKHALLEPTATLAGADFSFGFGLLVSAGSTALLLTLASYKFAGRGYLRVVGARRGT
jgi:ABC-2 type transport system permease protein